MKRLIAALLLCCLAASAALAGSYNGPFRGWGYSGYRNGYSHQGWTWRNGYWYSRSRDCAYDYQDQRDFFPIGVFALQNLAIVSPPPRETRVNVAPVLAAPAAAAAPAPPSAAVPSGPSGELLQVLDVLKSIDSRVKTTEGRLSTIEARIGLPPAPPALGPAVAPVPGEAPAPPMPPAPAESPKTSALPAAHAGLTGLLRTCSACHADTVATERGGSMVFFRTGLRRTPEFIADERQRDKMRKAIQGSTMPPEDSGVVLTAQEKADAIAFLTSTRS